MSKVTLPMSRACSSDETKRTARTEPTPDAGSADVRPQLVNQLHMYECVLGDQLIMHGQRSVLRKPCVRICAYVLVSEIQGV